MGSRLAKLEFAVCRILTVGCLSFDGFVGADYWLETHR
jgi:hypothetical protein